MKCLSCDGKRRPTIKEVSMELEALRKSQKCLEIFQEPHLLRDEASLIVMIQEANYLTVLCLAHWSR